MQEQKQGLVAVLDALGAKNYADQQIIKFFDSRTLVMSLLKAETERILGTDATDRVTSYIFNDTVVISYETKTTPCFSDVEGFFTLLRDFEVKSISNGIFFRGAISMGSYWSSGENTIMGKAITDAAEWYDKADWIGVIATPKASMLIRACEELEGKKDKFQHLIVEWDVPLKNNSSIRLKAVNWAKGFYVEGVVPVIAESQKGLVLNLLANGDIPKGTERKYFNTMVFFDQCHQLKKDK